MRGAGVTSWTREQIEAWVVRPTLSQEPHAKAIELLVRRTLVRLCPEARDYAELAHEILTRVDGWRVPYGWHARTSEAEAIAHCERAVAALWQQSISEPEATPSAT